MTRYLLDTNIVSYALKGQAPNVATKLARLKRSDVVLPRDLGRRDGPAFIVIRDPGKARRRGVRAQQVTIDDPDTIAFLAWALEGLARAAPIWPSTAAACAAFAAVARWRADGKQQSNNAGLAASRHQSPGSASRRVHPAHTSMARRPEP